MLVARTSVFSSGNNMSDIHTGYPTENKKSTQDLGAARKVGSVKKKDVVGELGKINAHISVFHVVQMNVKERIADTPLILVNFF